MKLTLKQFIDKYIGQSNVGNTPENKGQCVGLAMMWVENLGLPHIWGHAKDIFNNAPTEHWIKIKNTPNEYPKAGDILTTKGTTANGGYGHIGVVYFSSKSGDAYVLFEQNNWIGDSSPRCELTTYETATNWGEVIGWLRPKVEIPTEETDNDLIEKLKDRIKQVEDELGEMRISRNQHKAEKEKLLVEIGEERERHALEVRGKQKIIDDQQKLISEMQSKTISDAKTIETITKERNDWKMAYKALEDHMNDYTHEIGVKITDLEKKLTDSEKKVIKLSKQISALSFWLFIKLKLGVKNV